MHTNSEIYEKSYEEALKENERAINKIRQFKKELEDVRSNLELNQKHLYQNVMIPIGSKALLKGKLVHTNEITINIGDKWFLKKSATGAMETCDRMIERCRQNLAEFEKETHLLSSNLEVPSTFDIFPSGDVQEIVEPYDEEEEKKWKEQHCERVKQYKQKLAAARDNDDEDIYRKLDKLELDEEDLDEEEEEEEEDDDEDDITEDEYEELIEKSIQLNEDNASPVESVPKKQHLAKRVSFSECLEKTQGYSPSAVEDPDTVNIIYFKHSGSQPVTHESLSVSDSRSVKSPSDLYKNFMSRLDNVNRKSILKRTIVPPVSSQHEVPEKSNSLGFLADSYEDNWATKVQKSIIKIQVNENADVSVQPSEDDSEQINIIGDIKEKIPDMSVLKKTSVRPVSAFKQSRMTSN